MISIRNIYSNPLLNLILGCITVVALISLMVVAANAQTPITDQDGFCDERESNYQNGVLLYRCEIVEQSPGIYLVIESGDSIGQLPLERLATAQEIALYVDANESRECLTDKRIAEVALSTPEVRAEISALATRVSLIESAIKDCN